MKKYLLFLILVTSQVAITKGQDAIVKFYEKYMDNPDFTSIYISNKMFSLMAELPLDEDDKHIKKQLQDLSGLRILTSDRIDGWRMYKEASSKLVHNGYEELMVIKEGDDESKFLVLEKDGKIRELLLISGDDRDFFILSMVGIIDIKTIAKISKSMDIDGMEQFEKLGN